LDIKEFQNGLLSLVLVLLIFSATLVIGSITLKQYININVIEREFIIILSSLNFLFGIYYLREVFFVGKVFKLETKNIIKFGKRIGLVSLPYLFHFFFMIILFFSKLHNLLDLLVLLIIIIELLIIVIVLKESYDLVFLEENRRNSEIEENRKIYFKNE
jgi:hypothetical protein